MASFTATVNELPFRTAALATAFEPWLLRSTAWAAWIADNARPCHVLAASGTRAASACWAFRDVLATGSSRSKHGHTYDWMQNADIGPKLCCETSECKSGSGRGGPPQHRSVPVAEKARGLLVHARAATLPRLSVNLLLSESALGSVVCVAGALLLRNAPRHISRPRQIHRHLPVQVSTCAASACDQRSGQAGTFRSLHGTPSRQFHPDTGSKAVHRSETSDACSAAAESDSAGLAVGAARTPPSAARHCVGHRPPH